ncbi:MAG: metallophosphoesterase family protein [Thermodesulfobacteriota bacterium]
MRFAIISDLHSNLEALNAVLSLIDSIGADTTICLGDIVGYNADPDRCIELVRERGIRCIIGNHDSRVCGFEEPDDFNSSARRAVLWTREHLSRNNLSFLRGLPRKLSFDDGALAVHGWVNNTDRYILTPGDAQANFELLTHEPLPYRLCFFGHTHIQIAYSITENTVLSHKEERLKLGEETRYIINPGSVGQPRDFDTRAAFLIYDTEAGEVRFYRTTYDIDGCYQKVIDAGLPENLAERLKMGC